MRKIMKTYDQPSHLMLISALIMSVIFVVDLVVPLGVAGGVLYIIVILTSLWFDNKNYVIGFAIACTILILVGLYFSPSGGELWQVITNRIIGIFSIWVTAILAAKAKVNKDSFLMVKSEAKMKKEKYEIYISTMRCALHITNNLLNQLQFVDMEIQNHKDFDKDVVSFFDDMKLEARTLLSQLSAVKEIEANDIAQSVYPQ